MLKNKPWQIWAILAVHSVTLVYVIYELVRRIISYPVAGTDYAAAVVLGAFSFFFMFRGSLTGLILEIIYFLSLFYCGFHYADVLAVIILIAVFAMQKPARGYFKTDLRVKIKQTIMMSAAAIVAAIISAVILYNIDGIFYISHSKQDLDKITAYITETYGGDAEIDDSSYKQLGSVYITTSSGEWGSVNISSGMIIDNIVIDKLEEQYNEKINEGLELEKYYISIYPLFVDSDRPQASINIMDFRSETEIYDESSINRVYQMFSELIDDGYEVSVSPGSSIGFMGIVITGNQSLLFPFLNTEPSEYDIPPPSSVKFTEKCSAKEFAERINENIRETQFYRDTHPTENMYGGGYQYNRTRNIAMAIALLVTLPFYVMQSVALFVMTKRRNLSKPWLAWIPHISQYSLAKISDDTDAFHDCGKTLAKRTLIIFALEVLAALLMAVVDTQNFVVNLIGFLVSVAATITMFQSAFRVYDAYLSQNVMVCKVLSFFFSSFAIPIILFTIRNNCPDEIIRHPPDNADVENTGLDNMS